MRWLAFLLLLPTVALAQDAMTQATLDMLQAQIRYLQVLVQSQEAQKATLIEWLKAAQEKQVTQQ